MLDEVVGLGRLTLADPLPAEALHLACNAHRDKLQSLTIRPRVVLACRRRGMADRHTSPQLYRYTQISFHQSIYTFLYHTNPWGDPLALPGVVETGYLGSPL